jgi:hypothetical protein
MTKIPLYVWTLIGVTQRNNSATTVLNAHTELFVNGISDKNCSTLSVQTKEGHTGTSKGTGRGNPAMCEGEAV